MQVRHYMQKDVVSVLPTTTLHEAAMRMKDKNIGSILVLEEGWKLRGILTDRDVALAVAAELKDPNSTFVGDVMVADPITVDAGADTDSALRIMNRANIRRLPVMDNGRLVGIITSADLAKAVKENFNQFVGLEEAFAKA